MSDVDGFAGKVALVTGGTSGTGFRTAEHLARRGAIVVVNGRSVERGAEAVAKLRGISESVYFASGNCADYASVMSVVEETRRHTGHIDILVSAGAEGIGGQIPFENISCSHNFKQTLGSSVNGWMDVSSSAGLTPTVIPKTVRDYAKENFKFYPEPLNGVAASEGALISTMADAISKAKSRNPEKIAAAARKLSFKNSAGSQYPYFSQLGGVKFDKSQDNVAFIPPIIQFAGTDLQHVTVCVWRGSCALQPHTLHTDVAPLWTCLALRNGQNYSKLKYIYESTLFLERYDGVG